MIQCFAKRPFSPSFCYRKEPQLVYVSKVGEEESVNPRVMHAHADWMEIVLITGGQGPYFIDGVQYTVCRGDLLIYNSGVVHDERSGPEVRVASYCCGVSLQLEDMPENALLAAGASPVTQIGEAACARLEPLFALMFDELSGGMLGGEEICHHLLLALIDAAWHLTRSGESEEEDISRSMLGERIKAYIEAHFAEDVSLQSIADALHVSPYYLSHVFKNMTGYPPLQYMLRRRIGEAQTLLITTDYPVTRIASMVGYDNPSHFNLLFTKNVGMTPRQYRRNYILTHSDGQGRARN